MDAFAPSRAWYAEGQEPLTIDGLQLTHAGTPGSRTGQVTMGIIQQLDN